MQNVVESSPTGPPSEPSLEPEPHKPTLPAGTARPEEIGGPSGPEPTRYGDWERNGRCIDF
jgi:hypothetical protein